MGDDPDETHRHLQLFMDKYSPEMVENIGMEHEICNNCFAGNN
jgi:hypothetical protein